MGNRIDYISFERALKPFEVFRLPDILKIFPHFDSKRLTEWQRKGYIIKLIKGCYVFCHANFDQRMLFLVANKMTRPSYVSLESALSLHGLIPEQAFSITSVTTQKTHAYETVKGYFTYKSIKESLFFGYQASRQTGRPPVLIADGEKALLDLLYCNPALNKPAALEALRLNKTILNSLDKSKLGTYLKLFDSATLTNRFNLLKEVFYVDFA